MYRFWEKVNRSGPDECWEWTAYMDSSGYGVIGIKNKRYKAHRLAWELTNGAIPKGVYVRHTCGNPACCNTAHLSLGTLMERFWSKVDKRGPEDCWEWVACIMPCGYGKLTLGGKQVLAHRIVYELEIGEIPDGLFVCHTCDNRRCVNPNHLFLGTNGDNIRDMERKGRGRHPKGEDNGMCKISDRDVERIRSEEFSGLSQEKIGRLFGINESHVSRIIRRTCRI